MPPRPPAEQPDSLSPHLPLNPALLPKSLPPPQQPFATTTASAAADVSTCCAAMLKPAAEGKKVVIGRATTFPFSFLPVAAGFRPFPGLALASRRKRSKSVPLPMLAPPPTFSPGRSDGKTASSSYCRSTLPLLPFWTR
ncbi:hypothetical protein Vretimale_8749 [Volvox reticuliferus]|uniref:Uncharacterized protein n=1 Tax=Volvox reticuliferus TaxID=1737510 RepID=A0A8J4GBH7_9CHLO|nr:hypothetical protein Vretifemale_6351 [Volvox reticuliferus]GIM04142.1 hypothetical protein Vretimale_8749 [Volvox reticuliferus]